MSLSFSNGYYVSGASSMSMSVGGASISHTHSTTVEDILALLTKQIQNYHLPFDSW